MKQVSTEIEQLQNGAGRLVQTLEQSSLDVWASGTSGFGRSRDKTVSYYVKGLIIAFLLDARIRHASEGKHSLDDMMRLAYKRYGGENGFTPEQFRVTAQEIAGTDLKEWFRKAISSTEELDYRRHSTGMACGLATRLPQTRRRQTNRRPPGSSKFAKTLPNLRRTT